MSEILSSYSYRELEPKYYEAMPGFLDYLTYIEATKDKNGKDIYVRRRLKPIEKDVYRVIKKLAGEGVCIRTETYIARMVGCSTHTLADAKIALSNPIEQMYGESLISIDKQMALTKKEGRKINKRPVHICHINPVWKYNIPFMRELYSLDKDDERRLPPEISAEISIKEAEIAIEKMSQPSVSDIVYNSGAERKYAECSKAERKYAECSLGGKKGITQKCVVLNNPTKPFVLKQDPMAEAIQMSLINQNNVEENFVSEHKTSEFLEILGFTRNIINEVLGRYSLNDIYVSVLYLKNKMADKEIKSSITGYLLKTLENKWWMPAKT